jgi:hypothetical protein
MDSIKQTEIKPLMYYSCQVCGCQFRAEKEHEIKRTLSPICSQKCKLKSIYNYIKKAGFTDEELLILHKKVEKNGDFQCWNREKALFSISKNLVKRGLATLK